MTQLHHIKFLHEVEGLSQRKIAETLGRISRNTLSKYLKRKEAPSTIQRQRVYGGTKDYSEETKRVLPIIVLWSNTDTRLEFRYK